MFKVLFDIVLNMLATIIQIVCWPLNAIIETSLPDISTQILNVTNTLNSVFDNITWALGLIPTPVILVLIFIVSVEIAKHTIFVSTHTLIKVWSLLQKLKFW